MGLPVELHLLAVEIRIDRLQSFSDVQRRHALQDEGILIAAYEINFFRRGIRDSPEAHVLCHIVRHRAQAGVLASQRHNVFEVVEEGNFVHVDVGDDLRDRHRGIVRVVVGTQQAFFFAGDGDKKKRAPRGGFIPENARAISISAAVPDALSPPRCKCCLL